MSKQSVFISCGQFTLAEKRLGRQIADVVKSLTDLEPFFAEDVQDLNGLDVNILGALRNCVGFITVLHPRGTITRPDGSVQTRASVWIEQEIAVATYIQRVEKRSLLIIAFKHAAVDREGIRDLLHLNPIEFTDETEVLAALPERLKSWTPLLKTSGISLHLISTGNTLQGHHTIRSLEMAVVNETNERITEYNAEILIPASVLSHWPDARYAVEVAELNSSGQRCFRFDETTYGPVKPRERKTMFTVSYCTACGAAKVGLAAAEAKVQAKIWIGGREYAAENTIRGLAEDRETSH